MLDDTPPRAEPPAEEGVPDWVMTFADLSTLLFAFFVLLLSFANMDVIKFREMLGSVQSAFGVTHKVHGEFQPTIQGEGSQMANSETMSEGEYQQMNQEMEKKLKEVITKTGMDQNAEVISGPLGVTVRVKGMTFFAPGSAQIKRTGAPFLNGIAALMTKFPFHLVIEGHTDNIPIKTRHFPSNWELSAYRSTVVLRYLLFKKIDPHRLMAVGYADTHPIASNDSAEGRAANRRVEFIFKKPDA